MLRSKLLVPLGLAMGFACCGKDPGTGTSSDDASIADVASDSVVMDTPARSDAVSGGNDLVDETAAVDASEVTSNDAGPCSGGSRCPCTVASDCDNALCLETATGHLCAAPCADASGCLPSEKCTQLTTSGGDIQTFCTPRWVSACAPCEQNVDCTFAGSGGDTVCTSLGSDGKFCTNTCQIPNDCPPTFTCVSGSCRPLEGTCTCSPWAIGHNATTNCVNQNSAGSCSAALSCLAAGPWPTCLAATATPETCNGEDDDCNGLTDDSAGPSCDDKDECTADACSGGVCQHLKNVVCGDGTCAGGCGENAQLCPIDCHICGNKLCEPGEGPDTCAGDCCGGCGDGKCVGYACGENPSNCPKDCGTACGNKICDKGENPGICPTDCDTQVCGNHVCEPKDGGPATCPEDCAATCGNCVCEKSEDFASCPNDCGYCGDGTCSICGALGEDPKTCLGDCGVLAEVGCTTAWGLFCKDSSPCTDDSCQQGKGCVHLAATATCTDGNACTTGDACVDAVCAPGTQVVCDDGNPCTTDSCDAALGCTATDANGIACSDGDPCTVGDACSAGQCASGKVSNCDDNQGCTDDGCVGGNCQHLPHMATCTDGNACTTGEHCVSGGCGGGKTVECDDGNPCTADACDVASGCTTTSADSLPCSDGNPCTIGDTCVDNACVSGTAPDCDDSQVCTEDSCAGGKCQHLPNTATCTDDNACTNGEHCVGGACAGAAAVKCDDANPCTVDNCDVASGCTATNADGATCTDGNPCTISDQCSSGACVSGQAPDCDDSQVCTDDSCADGKCVHLPNSATCTDSSVCTTGEHCLGGLCAGASPTVCDDGNICTSDYCDLAAGCTAIAMVGTGCADGNACTLGDLCAEATCTAGAAQPDCDDDNSCTADACAPTTGCVHTVLPDLLDCDAPSGTTCLIGVCTAGVCQTHQRLFDTTYGGANSEHLQAVAKVGDKGFLFAGTTFATDVKGNGWLVRTDAIGNKLWDKQYGGTDTDEIWAVNADANGFTIAGDQRKPPATDANLWLFRTDLDGNVLWEKTYGGTKDEWLSRGCLKAVPAGGYILCGSTASSGAGNADAWVVRVDATGKQLWAKTFGGTYDDRAHDVLPQTDGTFFVASDQTYTGYWTPWTDFVLIHLAADGTSLLYSTHEPTVDQALIPAVLVQLSDGFLMVGTTTEFLTNAGPYDMLVMRLGFNGGEAWRSQIGTTGQSDRVGSAIGVSGGDGGALIFGDTQANSAGGRDNWLVRIDSAGRTQWQKTFGGAMDDQGAALLLTTTPSKNDLLLVGDTASKGAGGTDAWVVRVDGFGNATCAQSGICLAQAPTACDDNVTCTRESCGGAASGCTYGLDATLCDDGNVCTTDACTLAGCTHVAVANGTACPDDTNPCTTDKCSFGQCQHPAATGIACTCPTGVTGPCKCTNTSQCQ